MRPDLPLALQQVVLRCLEKNRERRFGNVAELAFALAPFGQPAARRSAERIARVLGAAGFASSPHAVASALSQAGSGTNSNFDTSSVAKKSRTPLVLALCLLSLALAGAVLFAVRKNHVAPVTVAEPAVAVIAAAPAPSASVMVQPAAPPQAVVVASATAAASTAPIVKSKPVLKATNKSAATKTKAPPPPPTAPVVDPLDGRR